MNLHHIEEFATVFAGRLEPENQIGGNVLVKIMSALSHGQVLRRISEQWFFPTACWCKSDETIVLKMCQVAFRSIWHHDKNAHLSIHFVFG